MTNKFVFPGVLFFLMTVSAFAQETGCKEKWNEFSEFAQKNKYDATTYQPWLLLKKSCSEGNEAVYLAGEKILSQMVEAANASPEKNNMIAELSALYDEHDKKFPLNKNGNKISKAVLLYENNSADDKDILRFLDKSFAENREHFTQPFVIDLYSKVVVSRHLAGDEGLTADVAFLKLDQIGERIQAEKQKYLPTKKSLEDKQKTIKLSAEEQQRLDVANLALNDLVLVEENVEARISKLSNCESLEAFYGKNNSSENPNVAALQRSFQLLKSKNCNTPFFYQLAEKLNKENPSAETATVLAMKARQSRDQALAMQYFTQAAELEENPSKKAEAYYMLATVQQAKDKENALKSALKALEVKPDFGKSYILISQLYSSSANNCGKDAFEQKAIYWLAASTAKKAGQIEPSFKKSADDLAADYLRKAPSKEEIKKAGKKSGDVISFSCWFNESVSIPK